MSSMDDGEGDPYAQIPPEAIVWSSLGIGALSGSSGLLIGALVSTVRSSPRPGIFALASGLQWFALGSTFWASRSLILNIQTVPTTPLTPQQKTHASTISGALAGSSIGYLVRGRSSILPGTLLFSLLGFTGQTMYNRLDAQHTQQHTQSVVHSSSEEEEEKKKNIWHRLGNKKWSPMKVLSNEAYEAILREKLVRVDAEIAILDENLDALRGEEEERKGTRKGEEMGSGAQK